MKVNADKEESSLYKAMLAAQNEYARLKQLCLNAIHIELRGKDGADTRKPGSDI